jgi:nucleotide-binding universal stress UspA family protein
MNARLLDDAPGVKAPRPSEAPRLVVAATDFTPGAASAARRAARIAADSGARLVLFHAARSSTSSRVQQRLRSAASRLGARFGIRVETALGSGRAPSAIAAYAQSSLADLIVVGNRQAGFLADLLGVNTATRVRRRGAVPVLAVSRAASRPYARMVLAADFSPGAAHAGRVARRLFPEARMDVLHVAEPLYEGGLHFAGVSGDLIAAYRRQAQALAEARLARFVANAFPELAGRREVRIGHPSARIREYAAERRADAVVLYPGASWLAHAVAGSISAEVLLDPPCDVLLAG